MKKIFFAFFFVALCSSLSFAQNKYMQVTTIESIIPGGLGRSKMIVTDGNGKQSQSDMKNFYSMVGINMENIQENESNTLKTLNKLATEGWKVVQVTAGTQSPSEQYPQGIFITRYLLTKD